jgi:hypothetical protein
MDSIPTKKLKTKGIKIKTRMKSQSARALFFQNLPKELHQT